MAILAQRAKDRAYRSPGRSGVSCAARLVGRVRFLATVPGPAGGLQGDGPCAACW